MRIIITGPKGAGKSTLGALVAERTGLPCRETDTELEDLHGQRTGQRLTCREIFKKHGEAAFRDLEREAVERLRDLDWHVLVTGGSTLMNPDARRCLRGNSLLVMLTGSPEALWDRATANGTPPWLTGPDGPQLYAEQLALREEVLRPFADIVLDTSEGTRETLADRLLELIGRELAVRQTDANTYGDIIRVTTFGESHGRAIGCVLDGVKPGAPITEEEVQRQLDRRKPGQSEIVTKRKESDTVQILSGVFEGKATGAPIAMIVYNSDQRSRDYEGIKDLFRPGHADFTYYRKYGIRDYRGGGRSSGRETAARVACGAIARGILADRGVRIHAHAVEVAGVRAETVDHEVIESNPVRCADPEAAKRMEAAVLAARADEDSVGGIIQLDVLGLPPGLGDPVFGKLDARLTAGIMTIGATKGVEVGRGFELARMRGSEANDGLRDGGFVSNNAGGITGGISTGQPLLMRIAVKPTSSISKRQQTIDVSGDNREIETQGRHDPCIVPRIIPVIENMAALVILDAWEVQARLRPGWDREQTGNNETT